MHSGIRIIVVITRCEHSLAYVLWSSESNISYTVSLVLRFLNNVLCTRNVKIWYYITAILEPSFVCINVYSLNPIVNFTSQQH